jgi:hypothetical protein
MRVLFLSPFLDPNSEDGASSLARLGETAFQWDVRRLDRIEDAVSPSEWLSNIRVEIQYADILVAPSIRAFFARVGYCAEEFLELILTKMKQGCPALFGVNVSDIPGTNIPPAIGSETSSIFWRALDISPQNKKVSEKVTPEGRRNPYITEFTKDDNCLCDPEIFLDVDKVTMAQACLLNYDNDAIPLIEASDMHNFVNSGDFFTNGVLGRKAAVAVHRRTRKEMQIILSGGVFSNSYDGMYERIPGFDENEQFIKNVIMKLNSAVESPESIIHSAYDLFSKIERGLGMLVKEKFPDNIEGLCPPDILRNLKKPRGEFDYSKATLFDIVEIISKNWNAFRRGFVAADGNLISKNKFKSLFGALNRNQRRYLAHPIKSRLHEHEFSPTDIEAMERLFEIVKRARKTFGCESDV